MSELIDLSDTIKPKSTQLNGDDLITGPIVVSIQSVKKTGDQQQPTRLTISGGYQPFLPCLTMRRILIAAWGTNGAIYVGRKLELHRDPKVIYGGEEVGGIRITKISDIDAESMAKYGAQKSGADWLIQVTKTRGKKQTLRVRDLANDAAPSASPFWPQEKFTTKLATIAAKIQSGERTESDAVAWFEKTAPLTSAQKAEIRALVPAASDKDEF